MYINSLGTEISQNHLSILKWSLNKYWGWKLWILNFQMPCRMHFSESWMQRSIISNEKSLKHSWFCSWYIRNFEVLLEKYVKSLKLQKHAQTHPDIQSTRATRCLKAYISYFLAGIFLGTTVAPMVTKKKQFQSNTKINEKHTHLTHKWHCTTTHSTPMVPQNVFFKSARFKLFNTVSTIPVAIPNPNLHHMQKKYVFKTNSFVNCA